MEDSRIIELYWERSEKAIAETAAKYGSYCYSIAYNVLNNREEQVEGKELSQWVNEFVSELPEEERKVFVCRYWYLDSVDAIALRFGFTKSKVKSMLMRTRGKLKACLENHGVTV